MNKRLAILLLLLPLPVVEAQTTMPDVPYPEGNEATRSKVLLGKALFWDEQLSSDDTVACGTCHRFAAGGSDPRTFLDREGARHPGPDRVLRTADDTFGSPGVRRHGARGESLLDTLFGTRVQNTDRRPKTVVNAAFFNDLFWDQRADDTFIDPVTGEEVLAWGAGLETQSLSPVLSEVEMGHVGRTFADVAEKLEHSDPLTLSPDVPTELETWIGARTYPELFAEAFGSDEITAPHFAMAIATYERTLVSDQAPIFLDSDHPDSLTDFELAGFDVYVRAGCNNCHPADSGVLSDGDIHFIGVDPTDHDPGIARATGDVLDSGYFPTPTILNAELRAPYFHDGSAESLEDVIEFYDRGGDFGSLREIGPLGLNDAQKEALLAFLTRPLTDPRVRDELPPFDRPTLSTERDGRTGPVRVMAGLLDMTADQRTLPLTTPRLTDWDDRFGLFTWRTATQEAVVSGVLPVGFETPDMPALLGRTLYARWRTLGQDPGSPGASTLLVGFDL